MDPKRLRTVWDALMALGLLAMAVAYGEDRQRLAALEDCVKRRGCVPISLEASERFVCIESKVPECKR